MRRVAWRLMPWLMLGYFIAFVDRVNVGFAALQMNRDLGLGAAAFGLGGGLFFLSYALLEVPSNLIMKRVGARLWIARIMITWGLVSAAMALVVGPKSFYALRLLLGAAEAGFFPGVILYVTYWFPIAYRARIIATFMVAIPLSSFLGSPISAALLQTDGWLGLRGWQWLFILEAAPAVILGIGVLWLLPNQPADARWLTVAQRDWLTSRLATDRRLAPQVVHHESLWRVLANRHVLVAALLCGGSAAVSQSLSLWQPQILKSFGLSDMMTGLLNALPFGLASVIMILWGRRSDDRNERVWHTAIPLALVALALFATLLITGLVATMVLLCLVLIGAYAFKGPFWSLSTSWLSSGNAAAGIAQINAIGAIATFAGSWLLGEIKERSGSFPLALMPLAIWSAAGVVALLLLSRGGQRQR